MWRVAQSKQHPHKVSTWCLDPVWAVTLQAEIISLSLKPFQTQLPFQEAPKKELTCTNHDGNFSDFPFQDSPFSGKEQKFACDLI